MNEDTRAEDFLRPPSATIALRPLSSGSYAILHRTKNAFVTPTGDQPPDHLGAALEYAYIHGAPLDAVLRAAYSSPEVFRAEVFRFSQSIPVVEIPDIIREVESGLTAAASQSVDVVPRPGSEDRDAPPNS
jgi:hypothetical protein